MYTWISQFNFMVLRVKAHSHCAIFSTAFLYITWNGLHGCQWYCSHCKTVIWFKNAVTLRKIKTLWTAFNNLPDFIQQTIWTKIAWQQYILDNFEQSLLCTAWCLSNISTLLKSKILLQFHNFKRFFYLFENRNSGVPYVEDLWKKQCTSNCLLPLNLHKMIEKIY